MSQREGRSPGRGQPDVRHPEPHLSAGCCQAWHPWALITEEAAFPFLLGKESGPSKVAKDLGSGLQRQKDRGRGQEGTLWRCQQTSEVGARHGLSLTQLSSAPLPHPRDARGRELGLLPPVADRSSFPRCSVSVSPGLWERKTPACSFALLPLTCVLFLSVGSSARPLPARLPPGTPVRGPSARTGPTVWTRAAGRCVSVSRALVAPNVRSCSVSTSWIGTLTCSSPTCRTGRGPTSHCRCVPWRLVTGGSRAAGDPPGQSIKMHPCPGISQSSLDVGVRI